MSLANDNALFSSALVRHLVCGSIALLLVLPYSYVTRSVDRFRVEQKLPETLVDGVGDSSELSPELAPIYLDLISDGVLDDTDLDSVTSIQVRQLVLEIAPSSNEAWRDQEEDGLADNFNFLQSVKLYITAEVHGELKQEYLGGVDDSGVLWRGNRKQLTMKQTGMDIKPYVEAPSGFRLLAYVTGTPPPDKVIFSGKATYRINTQGS